MSAILRRRTRRVGRRGWCEPGGPRRADRQPRCLRGPWGPGPGSPMRARSVAAPGFDFARDSFAFPNLIRARHPAGKDLYANYCFVLARGLRQFAQFARFDPAGASPEPRRVRGAGPAGRRAPALEASPAGQERVVIPGYAGPPGVLAGRGERGQGGTQRSLLDLRALDQLARGASRCRAASRSRCPRRSSTSSARVGWSSCSSPTGQSGSSITRSWPMLIAWSGPAVELTVWDPNNPATAPASSRSTRTSAGSGPPTSTTPSPAHPGLPHVLLVVPVMTPASPGSGAPAS